MGSVDLLPLYSNSCAHTRACKTKDTLLFSSAGNFLPMTLQFETIGDRRITKQKFTRHEKSSIVFADTGEALNKVTSYILFGVLNIGRTTACIML